MGIQKEPAALIAQLARTSLPKGFSVCELGDQGLCGDGKNNPAQPWYESLGCGRYVSIDGNGRGTLTADLNRPCTDWGFDRLKEVLAPFDLVTDFGTGEHLFDQAQVWRTLHELVKPGGFIAFDRPGFGYEKHCFYITNECLYRDIAVANDYKLLHLERRPTPRGALIGGLLQRTNSAPFKVPQQGRYRDSLVIPQ